METFTSNIIVFKLFHSVKANIDESDGHYFSKLAIPQLSEVNLHNDSFPFKLESNNNLVWVIHIQPLIIGRNVEDFINITIQKKTQKTIDI